jgi:hypothetical protein
MYVAVGLLCTAFLLLVVSKLPEVQNTFCSEKYVTDV